MYKWLMEKAAGRWGEIIIYVMSFLESFISPVPPDIVIAVVVLNKRNQYIRIVSLCVLWSVLGGIIGYCIGAYSFEYLGRYIISFFGGEERFLSVTERINKYAFWVIAGKGFLPIPFKLVAIASGLAHVNILIFIIAAIICRTTRFLLIGYICHKHGEEALEMLEKHSSKMGWILLISIIVCIAMLFYR